MPAKKSEKNEKSGNKTYTQIRDDIALKALALADAMPWDVVTLCDIADAADMNLAELSEYFCDKTDVLVAFGRLIDRRVLADLDTVDHDASEKERLFDVLMDRYDVLNDYRGGLMSILKSFRLDPKQALISMPHLCRSMTWMLEAAGLEANGIKGAIKVAGLSGIYLKTLKVWMGDKSPDLSKTMASLDKDLRRAESFANTVGF